MYLSSSLEEPLPSLLRELKLEAQDAVAASLAVDAQQDQHTLQYLVDLGTAQDIPAILVLVIQEDLLRLV